MNNSIDLIIPTMWKESYFINYLEEYSKSKFIQKIIVIDNNYQERPKSNILNHEKIKIVCYNKNIYVNPAWNEGYFRSNSDVLSLLNDDIFVDEEIFKQIFKLDFSEIDIIGVHLKGSEDNFHIAEHPDNIEELKKLDVNKKIPIGRQNYAFGVCMFIKRSSYRIIPSLYRIWFGDDYLVQNCKNIYYLKTNKIKGKISKTIDSLINKDNNDSIKQRIILDSKNAFRFNHFLNSKNWDILKKMNQT